MKMLSFFIFGALTASCYGRTIGNYFYAPSYATIEETDVLVVGSGLSGSTTAFYLHQDGKNVVVAEAEGAVGGNIASRKSGDGFMWEEGPNTFQPTIPLLQLAHDLNISDDLVYADASLPRYIYWKGKLLPLPMSFSEFMTSRLLSLTGKVRLIAGLLGCISGSPSKEETIKEFALRHLGKQAYERIVDPFISGIYAGNPDELSISAALNKVYQMDKGNGLIRGMMTKKQSQSQSTVIPDSSKCSSLRMPPTGSLGSFKNGMESIPLAVKQRLGQSMRMNHRLESIRKSAKGYFSTLSTPEGIKTIFSKAVVLTTPTMETARLLSSDGHSPADHDNIDNREDAATACPVMLDQAVVDELKSIPYPPITAAVLAYPLTSIKIPFRGFGHLIPRRAGIRTLGTIWVSSLFPERAPPGYCVLCSFMGGSQDPDVANLTSNAIVGQMHEDLKTVLLTPNSVSPRVLGIRSWKKSIPQYNLGHKAKMDRLQDAVQKFPGLFLGGNYRTGVSLGDCIAAGGEIARNVSSYLEALR